MAKGEHALADELGLEQSATEVEFEGVTWCRDDGGKRRGPYHEDLGEGPECWHCKPVPSVCVMNYVGRHDSGIFSGWEILSNGCGVLGSVQGLASCLEAANRYAAELSLRRIHKAEKELDDANEADLGLATIHMQEAA